MQTHHGITVLPVILTKLLVRISVNNGTESKNRLIPIFAIEDEERDPVQEHHGMTVLPVILTNLLVRISVFCERSGSKDEILNRSTSATTGCSLYPHSILSAFSLTTIHEDGKQSGLIMLCINLLLEDCVKLLLFVPNNHLQRTANNGSEKESLSLIFSL